MVVAMDRDEFEAAVLAYAAAKNLEPVSNVLQDSELRWYYERAHRSINEAEVVGPRHAITPVITCDGGRIWLKPYWSSAGLAFASQSAAESCYRGAVERALASIFREEQARWEKAYFELQDVDARRDALINRYKAQGYRPDQIDDLVAFQLSPD
jgi:hypothetical protein